MATCGFSSGFSAGFNVCVAVAEAPVGGSGTGTGVWLGDPVRRRIAVRGAALQPTIQFGRIRIQERIAGALVTLTITSGRLASFSELTQAVWQRATVRVAVQVNVGGTILAHAEAAGTIGVRLSVRVVGYALGAIPVVSGMLRRMANVGGGVAATSLAGGYIGIAVAIPQGSVLQNTLTAGAISLNDEETTLMLLGLPNELDLDNLAD